MDLGSEREIERLKLEVEKVNARCLELAARVSFVCGTDTTDTMQGARATLVTRITELETQKPLAHQYFDSCTKACCLDDALMEAMGANPQDTETWPAGDFGYDEYDDSFELWGTRNDFNPTNDQLDAVWALGFKRGWICYLDGTEMYVAGHARGEREQRQHGNPNSRREERQWRRQRDVLETALKCIAALDNVRNTEDRPPLNVALERWTQCTTIAKEALGGKP